METIDHISSNLFDFRPTSLKLPNIKISKENMPSFSIADHSLVIFDLF
jgi:hypothetical protein